MPPSIRLTTAQAIVEHLAALRIERDGGDPLAYCAGVWAIFGHGNVAGLGEALWHARGRLPTWRGHNEQAMAHAAIGFAKASMRRRMMAVTTSIGPGATNLVTAAALAHVNRLPVLLLPGDVFASRAPDPVLQQLEDPLHGDTSVNECLRPVSRWFDRITRPEQIVESLPRAIDTMLDAATCGPSCIALPQDVQAMAFDCPLHFLQPPPLRLRRLQPDPAELERAAAALRRARRPLLIAGGGVAYAEAGAALTEFAARHGVPVAETQAGKGSMPWNAPLNVGAIGVTGAPAANALATAADLIIAVGTRLQDFTTGSHALFAQAALLAVNVLPADAAKWGAQPLVADARAALQLLGPHLEGWSAEPSWTARAHTEADAWRQRVAKLTAAAPPADAPASEAAEAAEAHVIGAVQDSVPDSPRTDIVVCAAGSLPGELHKLWRAAAPGNYHVEYGYSCMGYEIAGALGVKMARPEREVLVLVGDGSYLMLNSEIATSVMLGRKLLIVVLDNRGFGCIHRLQRACGGARFNNLLEDCVPPSGRLPAVDFAAHARSLGASAVHVDGIAALREALRQARAAAHTQVIVIDTDAEHATADGGCWWDVAIAEASARPEVAEARRRYDTLRAGQRR